MTLDDFLGVLEARLADTRAELVALVDRLDAVAGMRDAVLALDVDPARSLPDFGALLALVPDEVTRAHLQALGDRALTTHNPRKDPTS